MKINNVNIHEFERVDDLNINGYLIIQDPKKFCFGVDAVLLSDFAKIKKDDIVLDLGTGTGIIPILVYAKKKPKNIIGIDIQEDIINMAKRSVKLNNLEEKIKIIHGDIKNLNSFIKNESIDCITTNPPYINKNCGILNKYDQKSIARHEIYCNFEDIVRESAKVLRFGGRFFVIHKPTRLVEIISTMKSYNLEPKTMRFIHPYINKEPKMVLIEAVKGSCPMLKVLPPLINYKKDGNYTEEIMQIYYGHNKEIKC